MAELPIDTGRHQASRQPEFYREKEQTKTIANTLMPSHLCLEQVTCTFDSCVVAMEGVFGPHAQNSKLKQERCLSFEHALRGNLKFCALSSTVFQPSPIKLGPLLCLLRKIGSVRVTHDFPRPDTKPKSQNVGTTHSTHLSLFTFVADKCEWHA